MRHVVYSLNMSLDGFMARPDGDLDWVIVTEELHAFVNERERNIDTHLYGRRMYETMAAYWPTADRNPDAHPTEVEYALIWQGIEKVVFSTTLDRVEGNSRLVRDDIAGEVAALKAQPGKNIGVGGATLAASLLQLGLIDTYEIYLQPVILGEGIPMFPSPAATSSLRLVDSRTFDSGVVFLHYERSGEE
ncbi:MAG TPA: dihydrofolate reductase family protein [Thermomicrobiales bacterium]|nr:dihydrofolate reductase family protein [Thermomicrobiales bacterium]